jgi:hypothetical protein
VLRNRRVVLLVALLLVLSKNFCIARPLLSHLGRDRAEVHTSLIMPARNDNKSRPCISACQFIRVTKSHLLIQTEENTRCKIIHVDAVCLLMSYQPWRHRA